MEYTLFDKNQVSPSGLKVIDWLCYWLIPGLKVAWFEFQVQSERKKEKTPTVNHLPTENWR